jgi:hypothetical protein
MRFIIWILLGSLTGLFSHKALAAAQDRSCSAFIHSAIKEAGEERAEPFHRMAELINRVKKAGMMAESLRVLEKKYEAWNVNDKKSQSLDVFVVEQSIHTQEAYAVLEAMMHKFILSLPAKQGELPRFPSEVINISRLLTDNPAEFSALQNAALDLLNKILLRRIDAVPGEPYYDALIQIPEFQELKKIAFEYEDIVIQKQEAGFFNRQLWP